MNSELKELLRSVLIEGLAPVNKRLDRMEQELKRLDNVEQELKRLDNVERELKRFDVVEQELKRFDTIEQDIQRLDAHVNEVKVGQEQLQKNIIESLGKFTERIANHVDDKTAALNKRVYDIETEIQRLIRQ